MAETRVNGEHEVRSSEAAEKTFTKSFSKQEREPLASSKPITKSNAGITFAAQDKLPKLPIPDLDSSASKYLAALEPLQSPREHDDSKIAVQEFLRAEGPELQEKLKKYASGKSSYIEQFCRFSCHVQVILVTKQALSREKGTTHISTMIIRWF